MSVFKGTDQKMAFFYVFKSRMAHEKPRGFEDEIMKDESVFEETRRAPEKDAKATVPPSPQLTLLYFMISRNLNSSLIMLFRFYENEGNPRFH
jgi:hypothetical protein